MSQGSTEAPIKADQVIPVLLLTEEELNGTPEQIGQLLQYYVDTDDVCSPSFTDILVEKPSRKSNNNNNNSLSTEKKNVGSFSTWCKATGYRLQQQTVHTSCTTENPEVEDDDDNLLPSGPYFLSGPNLHQAYRLYPDTQDAFVYGMIPNDVNNPSTSSFKAVSFLAASDSMSKTIPVPSRHYYIRTPSKGRPLLGKRIALTDGLSLLGTQTTLSCKAWVDTYPPATEKTGSYVQKLLQEGAVLVGKTKTSQLRIGNSLWPETHFPANPRAARRGDIFDCGRGTGVGGVSAVAGYEWVEGAVGGDGEYNYQEDSRYGGWLTRCENVVDSDVRESGKRYGLYGLRRPFNGEPEKSNPGPNDNVGIFGRSLHDLSLVAGCTFPPVVGSGKESSGNAVKRIVYLDYVKDQKLEYAMDVFVSALERHLKVERTTVNLDEEWEKYRVKSGLEFSLSKVSSQNSYLYNCPHHRPIPSYLQV